VKVGVLVRDESIWVTQTALSELFAVGVPAIAKHLKNIFEPGELEQEVVVSILETTGPEGKNYQRRWYSLDAAIAVGYRINSYEATPFRIWATGVLRPPAETIFIELALAETSEAATFAIRAEVSSVGGGKSTIHGSDLVIGAPAADLPVEALVDHVVLIQCPRAHRRPPLASQTPSPMAGTLRLESNNPNGPA